MWLPAFVPPIMIPLLIYSTQGMQDLMPIDFLTTIICLGKKYEINYLCNEGLKRLWLDFPNTLEQWNMSSQEYS